MSDRIDELDADPDQLASDAALDPALVRSWIAGAALPEDDQIRPLAKQLSLPRSLLREARRVAEQSLEVEGSPAEPDVEVPTTDASAPEYEPLAQESTMEQAIVPAVVVQDVPEPDTPSSLERALELVRSPIEVVRARMERRKARALAPTEQPSYVEDDRQRTTYQLRAIFTAGGVIALALILRWALNGFGSSLADLWNTLTSTL